MPPGDKSSYTGKQQRKADHIAGGYVERGVSEKEAGRRAWATEINYDGGGKTSGSGGGKAAGHPTARKVGLRDGGPLRRARRPTGPPQRRWARKAVASDPPDFATLPPGSTLEHDPGFSWGSPRGLCKV